MSVKVNIFTKHGHNIQISVENMEEARALLTQPFITTEAVGRFTAIAISSIEVFDAQEVSQDVDMDKLVTRHLQAGEEQSHCADSYRGDG